MMQAPQNRHSQFVSWAKIILPLFGLALLSTLFLFARGEITPSESFVAEVESIAREQKLNAPAYSGVTDNGAVIALTAKHAIPSPTQPDVISIDDIIVNIQEGAGDTLDVTALTGEVDTQKQIARLSGLAKLWTSTGYEMETNGLLIELDEGILSSDSVLEIIAPFGTLSAGRVVYTTGESEGAQRLLFTQGVRLLYTPKMDQSGEGPLP